MMKPIATMLLFANVAGVARSWTARRQRGAAGEWDQE
jgi:hypothetical protein